MASVSDSHRSSPIHSDQWLDVESPDMYPVGWCFLVKHRLEAPKVAEKPQPAKGPKKRGRKKLKQEDREGKW